MVGCSYFLCSKTYFIAITIINCLLGNVRHGIMGAGLYVTF